MLKDGTTQDAARDEANARVGAAYTERLSNALNGVLDTTQCGLYDRFADDYYGVHVENDMDERRLRYLLEQIGVSKLAVSVSKYRTRWPNSKPFVSTLLKWHCVKVPTRIYATINVPVYYVYLLVHPGANALKIGVSGNWVSRTAAFSHKSDHAGYDLGRSVGVLFHADAAAARRGERDVKEMCTAARIAVPSFVPYGAGGHYEWFSSGVYEQAISFLRNFESPSDRQVIVLSDAISNSRLLYDQESMSNA